MERKTNHVSLSIFAVLVCLLFSQNLLVTVTSITVEHQKNFYTSDPLATATPSRGFSDSLCSHRSPPSSSSHGSGSSGHGSSPPSHSGGGYYNPSPSPPSSGNCGSSPPHDPSTPSTPSRPSTPSNPPSSGGGYYNSPPSTPSNPSTPPITLTPPSTPVDPGTPSIPSVPPFLPSPSPFTGTCNYWRNHPGIIWGVLGWWGTLGNAFGATNLPGSISSITLPQALSNTSTNGLGALYREGTASFLNSLVNHKFPYTTEQVRDRFTTSLHSNNAATTQAQLFKMANEGRMKLRT